jgi:hypothetical protein
MLRNVCNSFQMFFRCFCKCFRRMFQAFHLSSFIRGMLQVLYLNVSRVDRTVANGMRKGSGRRCEPVPRAWSGSASDIWGGAGPLPGPLLISPMQLGTLASLLCGHRPTLTSRIGRPALASPFRYLVVCSSLQSPPPSTSLMSTDIVGSDDQVMWCSAF